MPEATEKPTVFFIPGAWHVPDGFNAVRALLTEKGFPSESLTLPTLGAEPPTKHLQDDIDAVHAALTRLADDGKQIVVTAHSYGGMVGSGAVEGLGYAERAKAGKRGGVIMLIYMTAHVVPKGVIMKDLIGGEFLPWMRVDGDYFWSSQEETIFYNDLSPTVQAKWISKLQHEPANIFCADVATFEPWHHLPCMYIFCEKDMAIPIDAQEKFATTLGDYTSFRCNSSHSPFLSMPEKVVEAIELGAKEGAKKSGL